MSQKKQTTEFQQKLKKQLSYIKAENIDQIQQKLPPINEQKPSLIKKQRSFQEIFDGKISKITKKGTKEELNQTNNPVKLNKMNSDPYLLQETFLKPRKKSILKNNLKNQSSNQENKKQVSFTQTSKTKDVYLPKIKQNNIIQQLDASFQEEQKISQNKMQNNILKKQPSFQEIFKDKISKITKKGTKEELDKTNNPLKLNIMKSDPYLSDRQSINKNKSNIEKNIVENRKSLTKQKSLAEILNGGKTPKAGPYELLKQKNTVADNKKSLISGQQNQKNV